MMYFDLAMARSGESTSGKSDGCGLLYRSTSANAVTRRWPLFGFLARNEGLRYSTVTPTHSGGWKMPCDSRSSNFSCSSAILSGAYSGSRPFHCGGCTGPICLPLLQMDLRNLYTQRNSYRKRHHILRGSG